MARFEWQLAMRVTASAYKRQIGVIATPDLGTGKNKQVLQLNIQKHDQQSMHQTAATNFANGASK
jgi:hypothetical protein